MLVVCFRTLNIEKDWAWVKERASPILCEDTKGIVAEDSCGIVGAVIFDQWSETSCQIHIAIDKVSSLRHGLLEHSADYVFNTCGRIMMIGLTPADNEKSVKFNEHIGLREIGRITDGYKIGVDFIVTRIDRDTCRWLKEEAA